jgi:hypothetical protein
MYIILDFQKLTRVILKLEKFNKIKNVNQKVRSHVFLIFNYFEKETKISFNKHVFLLKLTKAFQ